MTVIDPVFGPLVYGGTVERAVMDTLRIRTPTYLHWLERNTTIADGSPRPEGALAPIAWWRAAGRLVHDGDEPLPTCVLISRGNPDDLRPRGNGRYDGTWEMRAGVLVGTGGSQADTRDVAMLYALACRKALLQEPSLGGVSEGVHSFRETYDDLPPEEERTLGIATVRFMVDMRDVDDEAVGPVDLDPDAPPYPDREPPGPIDNATLTVERSPLA